ncbi:hypothetical protein D3C86_1771170 [compost metagenome]
MEGQAVVEALLDQLLEVGDGLGGLLGEEHDGELALGGGELDLGAERDLVARGLLHFLDGLRLGLGLGRGLGGGLGVGGSRARSDEHGGERQGDGEGAQGHEEPPVWGLRTRHYRSAQPRV